MRQVTAGDDLESEVGLCTDRPFRQVTRPKASLSVPKSTSFPTLSCGASPRLWLTTLFLLFLCEGNLWKGLLSSLLSLEVEKRGGVQQYRYACIIFVYTSAFVIVQSFCRLQRGPPSKPRFRFLLHRWPQVMSILKKTRCSPLSPTLETTVSLDDDRFQRTRGGGGERERHCDENWTLCRIDREWINLSNYVNSTESKCLSYFLHLVAFILGYLGLNLLISRTV